jgi:hypothetical protein
VVADPSPSEAQAFAPSGNDRSLAAGGENTATDKSHLTIGRWRTGAPPAITRCARSQDSTFVEHMAMVAGNDDDPTGLPGRVQEAGNLAEIIGRPSDPQLVAARKLSVDRVVNNTNNPLPEVRDSRLDVDAELWSGTELGLVEQAWRLPRPGNCDKCWKAGETRTLCRLVAAGQPPTEQTRSGNLGHGGECCGRYGRITVV